MNKLRYSKPGTAPATLVAPPTQEGQKPEISLIEYDAHTILEKKVERVEEIYRKQHGRSKPEIPSPDCGQPVKYFDSGWNSNQ